jgi:hypothetical protein
MFSDLIGSSDQNSHSQTLLVIRNDMTAFSVNSWYIKEHINAYIVCTPVSVTNIVIINHLRRVKPLVLAAFAVVARTTTLCTHVGLWPVLLMCN